MHESDTNDKRRTARLDALNAKRAKSRSPERADEAPVSEEQFRLMFETHGAVMLLMEPRTGAIVDANEAAVRFYGYSREHLRTLCIEDINQLPPEQVAAERAAAQTQQRNHFVFPHRLANGASRWVEVYSSPVQLRGRTLLFSIIHDITERRQAEQLLQKTFASLRDALFIVDAETARITECNAAATEIFGYDHAEMAGRTTEFLHVDAAALAQFRQALHGAVAEKGFLFLPAFSMKRKDGSIFPTEHGVTPIVDENGRRTAWVSLVRDITEQKRAEEARWESETRYRALVEESADAVGVFQEGKVVFINPAGVQMLGAETREQLLGRTSQQIIHPEDFAVAMDRIRRRQKGETGVYPAEVRYVRLDGTPVTVEVNAAPITLAGRPALQFAARDVTERKRAEEALRASEAKLQAILDSSPCAIGVSDLEGRVVDLNPACLHMFGIRSKEEGLGRNVFEFVSLRDQERARGDLAASLAQGVNRSRTYALVRSDGSELVGEVTSSFLRDAHGKVTGFVRVATDITERERAETIKRIQHDLAVKLGAIQDLEGGLRLCLHAALHASGLDSGGVYLRDEQSGRLDLLCHAGVSDDFVARVASLEREAADTQLLLGGRPLYATFEELAVSRDEAMTREGLRAAGMIPILHGDQVIGGLNVGSHRLDEVPPYARSVLETIASQIGGTIARLKAEEALRKAKEFSERLIASMQDGFSVLDADGVHVDVNPALCRITGLTRAELVGVGVPHPYWPPEEIGKIQEAFARTLRGEFGDFELTFLRKNGERFPAIVSPSWIKDEQGKVISYFATFKDITERRRAEIALQQRADELRARNEELTRFNRASTGRELRMIELKREINELCRQTGQPARYSLEFAEQKPGGSP